ncbi:hypothetical protein D3C86_310350 [compost metagenome]
MQIAVIRVVSGVGFSSGWAELTLNTPPPLMPSCLMASWLAVGNRLIVCDPPSSVVAWAEAASDCTTPSPARTTATMKAMGSRT